MPQYDMTADLPAPVAEVTLQNPDTGAQTTAVMLIDTGADVTLTPREAAQRIGCGPLSAHTIEF